MITPNEFWLDVHRLSQSYEAEGLNSGERAENIIHQFRALPPTVQRFVLESLAPLACNLADIQALAIAAANATNTQAASKTG